MGLNLLEGEYDIKVDNVFLENTDKPSNALGDGIPRGILVLTNRRLFFFNTGVGIYYTDNNKSLLKSLSLNRLKLIEIPRYLQQMWNEKKNLSNINLEDIKGKYDFVVSLEKITNC